MQSAWEAGLWSRMLARGRAGTELCHWEASYHDSGMSKLRFQQLASHIHSTEGFLFFFYVYFIARKAMVISTVLYLHRAHELFLKSLGISWLIQANFYCYYYSVMKQFMSCLSYKSQLNY